jgi:hypothetical protein
MRRRQLIRELRAAEAELIVQRQALQRCGRARIAVLRGLHPVWLVGGGFLAGVVAQRAQALQTGAGLGSVVLLGLRLWPMLSSGWRLGTEAFGPAE